MSKYKIFIPEHLRAYRPRPLRWLGKFLMKITGWKTTGHLPKDQRVVLIAGPHTSNWDFVLAMSLILSLDVHIHWVGKHSIFKKGLRPYTNNNEISWATPAYINAHLQHS